MNRTDDLAKLRLNAHVGQRPILFDGFRQAKVDDLRNRFAVNDCNQNIRRLWIAMNDTLLMSVLNGFANLYEQLQSLVDTKLIAVAVSRLVVRKEQSFVGRAVGLKARLNIRVP